MWLFGCCRLSTPCGCACGGAVAGWHVRRSARASLTDSPRLFERSASARSEFRGARRNRPAAGLPRSAAQGSQTWERLFFGDFLLAKQKKVTAPPGALPGSRPEHRHAAKPTSKPRLRQAQPERLAQAQENTTNSIATYAYSKSARAPKHLNPGAPPPRRRQVTVARGCAWCSAAGRVTHAAAQPAQPLQRPPRPGLCRP